MSAEDLFKSRWTFHQLLQVDPQLCRDLFDQLEMLDESHEAEDWDEIEIHEAAAERGWHAALRRMEDEEIARARAVFPEAQVRIREKPKLQPSLPECVDCGCDCTMESGNYYTATQAAWAAAQAGATDHLCLDCFEVRLARPLSEADFIALPPEIMARFAGDEGEPRLPEERQRQLEDWRAWVRIREK